MSGPATMRWASAASREADPLLAAAEVAERLREALGEGAVDLALAFFTPPHVAAAEVLGEALRERLTPGTFAAASAHGAISTAHEFESGPCLSVIAARMPGVGLHPFILLNQEWGEAGADPAAFAQMAPGVTGAELVLLMGDPFSLDAERVLNAFHHRARGVRVVGGMASAGARPGTNVLILNDWVSHEGGIGLALAGALRADVIVSQGCRPVGPALEVTEVEGNLVCALDGLPALERAEQVLKALPETERDRLRHGLYVGRPARGAAAGPGDWLIRNLLGADRERGALAVGDLLGAREKIRFHVRDAGTAREVLELLLSPQVVDVAPSAALLFACNGRGQGLHGRPDGDISLLQCAFGAPVPAAGMFCAGEIGPVGERNFVHGHTASIALLRPARAKEGTPHDSGTPYA